MLILDKWTQKLYSFFVMKKEILKPIKKNDELIVEIIRYGSNGEGIAVEQGIVIFVQYALVGEVVKIHIINDKNSYLIAKIIEIIKPSEARVEPSCPYYYKCGGCDLQHMNNDEQNKIKKNIVVDVLAKIAKVDVEVNDLICGQKDFRYRNKFAFPVRDVDGEIKIGMFRKNSHAIIDIDDCLLQSENIKTILKLFREYLIENKISVYNEINNKGIIKHIVAREYQNNFILTVVVTDKKFDKFEPLIQKLKTQFNSFGIYKNINLLNNNVIFGEKDEHIFGLKELEIEEFGIRYFVNNRSFLQVNDEIKCIIYQKIIDLLGDQNIVVDAYAGAGLLSSIIAKNTKKVYGVEIIKEATQNAENLKEINNLYNLTNKNGDCAIEIPILAKTFDEDFAIVVDPPRKGLDKKVVDSFLEALPTKIVYLSCGPATLARDLGILKEKYDITFVQPYNMFPQTAQVETLVCLELKMQKDKKIIKKSDKNKKKTKKLSQNSRYFDFYDDVKSGCHKVYDW